MAPAAADLILTHDLGAVLQSTDKVLSQTPENTKAEGDEEEEGADANMEVKITEEIASFNEIIVWGHESIPADAEDAYMKGVEEWIGFAEAVCHPATNPGIKP